MTTTRLPADFAARYAASPAVPAPMTATSVCSSVMSSPGAEGRRLDGKARQHPPACRSSGPVGGRRCWSVAPGRALRRLAQPGVELLAAADEASIDEHLRHRLRMGDRAERLGADGMRQRDLREV